MSMRQLLLLIAIFIQIGICEPQGGYFYGSRFQIV
ncbi:hypothetical protein UABAM_05009 [Candidatus Uabimicrobium amorphum]|uniref:Uncharacterized protein n=1 Tax=Uabimicrobium amorphum TaxID=2596890 RepID=A0A5S9IR73_UABAM|nr:hypothetical protein UABAM_05009 [Candidatus Uabimicrobium amorphum]